MEAKPRQDELTIQEAAKLLEVTQPWLFKFLKDAGHLSADRIPKGEAAANGYIRIATGGHARPGLGYRPHWRPVITPAGLEWLVQEVARAQLEEQQQKAG